MVNFLKVFLSIIICLSFFGCVQMRNHTGVRDGAFYFGMHQGFDQGADKKDYYVVGGSTAIIIGDSKNEVIHKIGLPDQISTTLEGYETWIYQDYGIELIFKGDYLGSWYTI